MRRPLPATPLGRPALYLALAAAALYAAMWVGHTHDWGWLHGVDWTLLNGAHDIGVKHPAWVRFWDDVSFVLGPDPQRVIGAAGALIALALRRVRVALLLLFCLVLSGLVTTAAKDLAGRPRPTTALVTAGSTSFPSGHALEATSAALALLAVLLPLLGRRMRVTAIVVGALCVVTVGVARVALNVHHPSDVIAGWALGYLYFLLCLFIFRPGPIKAAG